MLFMKKKLVAWGMMVSFIFMLAGGFYAVRAQEHEGEDAAAKEEALGDLASAFKFLAAGFGMALATFGGALAQGRATSAAMEGISRNPGAQEKMFTPLVIGLVLIESLVIYTLVVVFLKL
jgi:F0F1-type ATP synthase membrane subunit c/vacuolar-type H+-ATPase subunit K